MTSVKLSEQPTSAATRLDVERIRDDFPILHQLANGKPLVYLDNAATAQKPRAVIEAVRRYYEQDNSNIHRGAHVLAGRATEAYEHARVVVQRFLNAARAEEIVFVRGTTEAVNLVAQSYGRKEIGPGDEILISAMEHHSNIVPWQLVCEQTGATLKVIPINDDGEILLDEYERLLSPQTKIVAITQISNALGTINPVREMVEMAHARDIPVLVDGAQSAPHIPVDVQELGCDFFCFSGHKVYGPTGIGVLYGRHALLERMPPYQGGGSMIRSVSFEKTTFTDPPLRFEAGTPNMAGAVGLATALDYMSSLGREAIALHGRELLDYATHQLRSIKGLRLIGTAKNKAAILSFVVDGVHADDIGKLLDQEGIAIRVGHHCCEPLMKRFNVTATARASLGIYNTEKDVDALAAGIRKAIHVVQRTCPVVKVEVRPSDEPIETTQDRIIREFAACQSWEDKYQKIIDIGKRHPPIPDELRVDKLLVQGCQSRVWMHARPEDGRVVFTAESDALIVNGLVALLLRVYSNRSPAEIVNTEPRFAQEIGLMEHLSPTRANGLSSMLKQIKLYALVLQSTMKKA